MKKGRSWLGIITLVAVFALSIFLFLPGYLERSMNRLVPTAEKVGEQALVLHKTLAVADLHGDTLMWRRDMLREADTGHIDLVRMGRGNVALQVFSSVTKTPRGQNYDGNGGETDNITPLVVVQGQPVRTWTSLLQRSLYHAEKLDRAVWQSRGRLMPVRSVSDLDALLAARGRGEPVMGGLLSIEGLQNLEGTLANLDRLHDAGYRMAGFAHFFDNDVSGSMHGLKKGGLTPLGRHVLARMEEKGMVVDIAHASHTAVSEILALAKKPVVSSHGGVQATCKVNRNLSDEEIRGVARTGGVVGIGYWDAAVCGTTAKHIAKAIRHVRDLVGVDHVGLGSDFDGATTVPFDTAGLALVTQALIDEGFTPEEIGKVMGGNVFRVLRQTLPAR